MAGETLLLFWLFYQNLNMNESNFISNLSFVDKIFIKVNIFYLIL